MDEINKDNKEILWIIETEKGNSWTKKRISIIGKTGNVYCVVIDKILFCSCPFFEKKKFHASTSFFSFVILQK